ncbi:hypothetical protein [Streptomyces sp. ODS28]|uniref:hypothetical protein n=1 Tax=Streptomyces sp. ODS28 TaxID=3136688 RepID=UPI0031E917DE
MTTPLEAGCPHIAPADQLPFPSQHHRHAEGEEQEGPLGSRTVRIMRAALALSALSALHSLNSLGRRRTGASEAAVPLSSSEINRKKTATGHRRVPRPR